MAFNRGEWSELYAIFYLLSNKKLKIVDSNMKMITDDLFIVESVIAEKKKGNIEFKIDGDYIIPIVLGNEMQPISTQGVNNFRLAIFKGITNSGVGGGAFKLDDVDQWLRNINIYSTYKGKSGNKQDLSLINLDLRREDSFKLGYSVKSQLGSPATILNASSQTNFKYKIKGLNVHELEQVNEINTRTKLIDRLSKIYELGGIIEFDSVTSEVFEKNLRMIDMSLPKALGEILLNSYKTSEKNLLNLFKASTIYEDEMIAIKKMKDFLLACSLGMFPGTIWNGEFSADGGLVIISLDSNVYILDLVYYRKEVENYLIYNTKLDSPSSKRYSMLELYEENNEIYFTLNLQVRYIK